MYGKREVETPHPPPFTMSYAMILFLPSVVLLRFQKYSPQDVGREAVLHVEYEQFLFPLVRRSRSVYIVKGNPISPGSRRGGLPYKSDGGDFEKNP